MEFAKQNARLSISSSLPVISYDESEFPSVSTTTALNDSLNLSESEQVSGVTEAQQRSFANAVSLRSMGSNDTNIRTGGIELDISQVATVKKGKKKLLLVGAGPGIIRTRK